MSVIRVLPEEVANRIAAGEVVERPAAVVKEVMENALDAGATRLELELEAGGTRLIRLRDDGEGMTAEDLALCIQPHATSKIANVEDLFRVASFGFRGEALPSIASVSELSITSRRRDEDLGHRLAVRGGDVEGPVPAGAPPGTVVEVRNLFFNVPARKKFLKQERTELGHCLEAVTRLLLPEPEVAIRVTHGGRRVQEIGEGADLRERVRTFFGPKVAQALIEREAQEGSMRLRALVGPPALARGTARQIYFFLNGRFIRDRALGAALREAYRGLIMPRDHPVAFLFLEMDPAEVDVNVHPTKTEVRFRFRERVFAIVHKTVRAALEEHAEVRPLRMERATTGRKPESSARRDLLSQMERELFAGGDVPGAGRPKEGGASLPRSSFVAEGAAPAATPAAAACGAHRGARPLDPGEAQGIMQLHRSYVLVESGDGLTILDQHALHERKLYEELLQRFRNSDGEEQNLLVPAVVELGAADQALILEHLDDLARVGLRIDPFGAQAVCVRALPALIGHLGGEEVVEEVLAVLRSAGGRLEGEDLIKDTVAGLACRAAVKFNDPLPEEELRQLVAFWRAHPELRNCPHGRPVAIGISLRDLESQFQRKR